MSTCSGVSGKCSSIWGCFSWEDFGCAIGLQGWRYFLGFWNLIGRLVVELETDKTCV